MNDLATENPQRLTSMISQWEAWATRVGVTWEPVVQAACTTLLHFEAVDYRCEAFVNGTSVGTHTGGNTPFSFNITEALKAGDNELIVRVEEVPTNHLADLKIATDAANGTITINPVTINPVVVNPIVVNPIDKGEGTVRAVVKDGDTVVAEGSGTESIELKITNAKLWSPSTPHLDDNEVTLLDATGAAMDKVESYAGIRTVGKTKDADGHWRFTLNGEIIFHWGPLDQGWWQVRSTRHGMVDRPRPQGFVQPLLLCRRQDHRTLRTSQVRRSIPRSRNAVSNQRRQVVVYRILQRQRPTGTTRQHRVPRHRRQRPHDQRARRHDRAVGCSHARRRRDPHPRHRPGLRKPRPR